MLKIILIKAFMLSSKEKIHISKKLSLVLRHKASHYGIQISQDGYVKVSDLLSLHLFKNLTFEDLKNIVDTNDKKRFQLIEKDKHYYIRANQGHSIKDVKTDSLLTQLHEPIPLIHGTFQKNIQSIKENGLKKMSRNHIHFIDSEKDILEKKYKSGLRNGADTLIYIDMENAINQGITFWKSDNNVILTEGNENGIVPPECIYKIISLKELSS